MFEQKNHGQDEQKSTSLDISSPEVTENDTTSSILDFVRNDTRSQTEIFDSLKERIKRDAGNKLTEKQAVEATRNLLGFFEAVFKSSAAQSDNNVDLQGVNGNVECKT